MRTQLERMPDEEVGSLRKFVVVDGIPEIEYWGLSRTLSAVGWSIQMYGQDAAGQVAPPAVVMVDICRDGKVDVDRLETLRREFPRSRLWAMTAYASMEAAVLAMKAGAEHCLLRPLNPSEICVRLGGGEAAAEIALRLPSLERFQREYIARVIQYHGGNITASAKTLCVDRTTLRRKINKYPPQY
jgi:two-component system response regulator RegA